MIGIRRSRPGFLRSDRPVASIPSMLGHLDIHQHEVKVVGGAPAVTASRPVPTIFEVMPSFSSSPVANPG